MLKTVERILTLAIDGSLSPLSHFVTACRDGHQVDYDELMKRNSTYREFEAHDRENCRMYKAADEMGGAK